MTLKQTFEKAINGYWDGGPKRIFRWDIDVFVGGKDKKGCFVRVGSWDANAYFNVAAGKTEKQTLGNARRRLLAVARRQGLNCDFEYEGGKNA